MNRVAEIQSEGWCCHFLSRDCPLFGRCVILDGLMQCVRCAAKEVGLPEGATAEEVVERANARQAAAA